MAESINDVTSFVTVPADIPNIQDHLLTTGACLNILKSTTLVAG
jgi:hypothetical protein